jgi:hypothetical protein
VDNAERDYQCQWWWQQQCYPKKDDADRDITSVRCAYTTGNFMVVNSQVVVVVVAQKGLYLGHQSDLFPI